MKIFEELEKRLKTEQNDFHGFNPKFDIGKIFKEFKSKLPHVKTIGVDDPPEPGQKCYVLSKKSVYTYDTYKEYKGFYYYYSGGASYTFDANGCKWISADELNKFFGLSDEKRT
jgi:hypothetical protein